MFSLEEDHEKRRRRKKGYVSQFRDLNFNLFLVPFAPGFCFIFMIS